MKLIIAECVFWACIWAIILGHCYTVAEKKLISDDTSVIIGATILTGLAWSIVTIVWHFLSKLGG
jgi:hypothetical protein